MNGDGPFGVPRPDSERAEMQIEERIAERKKIRAEIALDPKRIQKKYREQAGPALLLISESLDDYIEHRIETDKVLVGILKDIQGNTAQLAERIGQIINVRCYKPEG